MEHDNNLQQAENCADSESEAREEFSSNERGNWMET